MAGILDGDQGGIEEHVSQMSETVVIAPSGGVMPDVPGQFAFIPGVILSGAEVERRA